MKDAKVELSKMTSLDLSSVPKGVKVKVKRVQEIGNRKRRSCLKKTPKRNSKVPSTGKRLMKMPIIFSYEVSLRIEWAIDNNNIKINGRGTITAWN